MPDEDYDPDFPKGISMDCVDLKEEYGKIHRIGIDESYYANTGSSNASNTDPWNWILRGTRGHVCPWGGDRLAACTNYRGQIAKMLMKIPTAKMEQDGTDGVNVSFHKDYLDKAAKVLKLYKRPQLTDEQRQALSERGKKLYASLKNRS